ncbi:MAG: signal peptide peptidase SppA [Candidatus Sericytochromatia bacterium]|nr:signal peptide peptidase SppA [Candidatus Sericytochromatia bacterium]
MRLEKLWMAALLVACTVTAVGVWTRGAAPASSGASAEPPSPLAGFRAGSPAIAVITVDGMILEEEGGGGFGGGGNASARQMLRLLGRLRRDPPKALILRINSPGGSAAASQAIHDEILRLKRDKRVKVVAVMGDVCASGGYMIAAAADRIVANPATLTGSIGVIMHLANYEGLMGKVGVRSVTIKAGRLKDMGAPDRLMTREERRILQSIVDDSYALFLEAVATGRGWPVARVRPLAEGRIYTGRQAKAVGLVDELGTYEAAVVAARRLAGLPASEQPDEVNGEDWQRLFHLLSQRADPLAALAGSRTALLSAAYDRVPLMVLE